MQRLHEIVAFRDPGRSARELQSLIDDLPRSLEPALLRAVASVADPDTTVQQLIRLRTTQPEAYRQLTTNAAPLRPLTALFSNSRFLSETVIRDPQGVDSLLQEYALTRPSTPDEYRTRLSELLGSASDSPQSILFARFRRRELLRIMLRDVLGYATLQETTEDISNLADVILDEALRRIRAELVRRFGTPTYKDDSGLSRECLFSVIGVGKLGGRELNYSSDIDLIFVYTANGSTDGANSISNKEFYKKVANQFTDLLSTYTADGMCYRVDLRLRPDGRLGEVCLSLEGTRNYYLTRARDWELQMLIKARVAAGDFEPGCELLDSVESSIYSSTTDFSSVEAVSLTRERIHEKLAARRADAARDIKLSRGGIRDVEFLVQCLQRLYGGREPWVRHGGTQFALFRLRDKGLLSDQEHARLAGAYQFLRHIEHRLQFQDDRQTHSLPTEKGDLEILARQMPQGTLSGAPSSDRLLNDLERHLATVQDTYERVIHAHQPLYYTPMPVTSVDSYQSENVERVPTGNVSQILEERAPHLSRKIAGSQLQRGFKAFESFLENLFPHAELLELLDANPTLSEDTVDLFENSPYYAEELVRSPEMIVEVERARATDSNDFTSAAEHLETAADLRRLFRREMLRIQTRSVCLHQNIFDTLVRTSDLADAVIRAAYRIAVNQVKQSHRPKDTGYEPSNQMMVIALGRLGMREFDLGSDADLGFIIGDDDAREMQFWTRVANRMIDIISGYSGDGVMFSLDTRLRPNGGSGPLVQAVGGYRDYFATAAAAWEGISFMKARAVAGNLESGTQFLVELQEVDWRRYGQSGRSRNDLRQMRARLENEQGENNPLKAGYGGYYDIDFALMYLRLRAAGIFFKVLNTPERIDVIERMGHLDRDDAQLLRDAAVLYRAIDHALRVYSGHAEGKLPQAELHLNTVSELVRRWTPEHLHQPLHVQLAHIRQGTREYFRRLFG